MKPLLRRLIDLGVTPQTPRHDIRFIRVTNAAALIGFIAVCVYTTRLFYLGSPSAALTLLQIPPQFITLELNRRGKHRWATLVLTTTATGAFIIQPFIFGPDAGHVLFFLSIVAAAPVAFRRDDSRLMWGFMTVAVLAYLGFNFFGYAIVPLTELTSDTLHVIFLGTSTGVLVVILVTSIYGRGETFQAEDEAQRQHRISERLLENMLPRAVAAELKAHPERTLAARHDAVTVVFADIVGFSSGAAQMSASAVVERLDEIFSAFDALAERAGVEKIKTVGDAYMAAAGIPEACEDHAERAVHFAALLHDAAAGLIGMDGEPVRLRIGVHTGPAVAGVIGRRKPAYDLWGDTVNVASRMESTGSPGRTQVTAAVKAALRSGHAYEARGVVAAKGVGGVDAYFITSSATAA